MRNKLKKLLMISGSMMILASLMLFLYNIHQDKQAYRVSQETVSELQSMIPAVDTAETEKNFSGTEVSLLTQPAEKEEPIQLIEINGRLYCGYISIPALELELPVLNETDSSGLEASPCRYSGNANTNDLIIAAHNYSSHFGHISSLESGSEIFFTDCDGKIYRYITQSAESIKGTDTRNMSAGAKEQWQLTLFTCDISGRNRITIRALLQK